MKPRTIINGRHALAKNEWILSFVRRQWSAHAYLILEGLDEKDIPIRKKVHLAYKQVGVGEKGRPLYDETRAQIYYSDLSSLQMEEMIKEQNEFICKTFIIPHEGKIRLDEKVREDQGREIFYNLMGTSKSSSFFGASLMASGSNESKVNLIHSSEARARSGGSSTLSSLATLRDGHNCASWAEEAIRHINPALDPTTRLAKYVVVLPHYEVNTKCVIL